MLTQGGGLVWLLFFSLLGLFYNLVCLWGQSQDFVPFLPCLHTFMQEKEKETSSVSLCSDALDSMKSIDVGFFTHLWAQKGASLHL